MRTSNFLRIIFGVLLAEVLVVNVYGQELECFEVKTSVNKQNYPSVSGEIIVWQESSAISGKDICGKNLGNGDYYDICSQSGDQKNPVIDGNMVVWSDRRNSQNNVYGCRIFGNFLEEFMVAQNLSNAVVFPVVCDDQILWQTNIDGNWQLFYSKCVDLQWTVPENITAGTMNYQPAISGNKIVFIRKDASDDSIGDVYKMNTDQSGLMKINEGLFDCLNPEVSDSAVVWSQTNEQGKSDVCYSSLEYDFEFCVDSPDSSGVTPQIYGNNITWLDDRDGVRLTYVFDLDRFKEYKVCSSAVDQKNPDVSDKLVVWEEKHKVKAAYLPEESKLKMLAPDAGAELLEGSKVCVEWVDSRTCSETLRLEYTVDFGRTWNEIALVDNDLGSYELTVPDLAGEKMVLRISSDSEFFASDAVWPLIIQGCGLDLKADLNGDCVVDAQDLAMLAAEWMQKGF